MTSSTTPRQPPTLDDKYVLDDGRFFLSGVQALVRMILDHQRADRALGRRTGTLVSGYQGSPLGSFDKEMQRALALHPDPDVVHRPGLNEDLSATAIWGSQLAKTLPGARYEGVLGVWYGKAPGLDRASDAIRQANLSGTGPLDGVVALVGDDPTSKSSTVPSASEAALAELCMPVFYPGSAQEILEYGPHAIACSRLTGLWTAMKVVTSVADSAATVDPVGPSVGNGPALGDDYTTSWNILGPGSVGLEQDMFDVRFQRAREFARLTGVNRVTVEGSRDWLGIVAAGQTYHDLREALRRLELSDDALRELGIRIWKLGMIHPLDAGALKAFATGCSELLVLEDKRPFLEAQIKQLLYGSGVQPLVTGKEAAPGAASLTVSGALGPATIATALVDRLRTRDLAGNLDSIAERLRRLERREAPAVAGRTPFFCSGCPHSVSTRTADDTLVGVGIGCHTMVAVSPGGKGQLTSMTQMGGEGAQWVGMAPFTSDRHFVQNVGDGTFFHSGSLALRWAVASGVDMTYKLLFNSTVAMTGGQDAVGGRTVPELARLLAAEGVTRIIITAEEPGRYRGASLPASCEVRGRDRVAESERELADTPGVTVLVHDQQCAAEKRRLRKRGKVETPDLRVLINERVCEGCGDCGEKSGCLSVVPVDTELGRKTQIHEPSCNKDFSCLQGDCPSFATVKGARRPTGRIRRLVGRLRRPVEHATTAAGSPAPPGGLPAPAVADAREVRLRMMGIGGTGVVTLSQIVGMAAHIEGKHVASLDQTGLAQKGGAVISDVRISPEPIDGTGKASAGAVDLYLAFDALGAAQAANLVACDPDRTVAVISTSAVPTGQMVADATASFPQVGVLLSGLRRFIAAERTFTLDAMGLANRLFGDDLQANSLALGAAYQLGALGLRRESIHTAFELNGAAVKRNIAAFEWGRAVVAAPADIPGAKADGGEAPLSATAAAILAGTAPDGELHRLLRVRIPDLVDYQSRAYAAHYAAVVAEVRDGEAARFGGGETPIACAVARSLHKLMAYKDEYEVARLLLDPEERRRMRELAGPGGTVQWHLHPPALRALGVDRKLRLGPWFTPALQVLRACRRVRGTRIDPFGFAGMRRLERGLVDEYIAMVERVLANPGPDVQDRIAELCGQVDSIRGYEEVKLRSLAAYRVRVGELEAAITGHPHRGRAAAS